MVGIESKFNQNMKKLIYCTFLICVINNTAKTQEKTKENSWTYEVSYTGDALVNMAGGIKTGGTYLGFATLAVGFDFEKADLWKGGSVYVKGGNTHGGIPSETLIGDYQVVSNIEAGNHTFIQEMWYKQVVKQFEFTLGVQDLNADFAVCEYACNFINSSFGVYSTFSSNLDIPIFPLTSLGFSAKWNVFDAFSWQASIFDGTIDDWENNPYNLNWSVKDGSFLFVNEFIWQKSIMKGLDGNFKLGGYYHNDLKNYGLYAATNQIVWQKASKQIESFLQFSASSPNINDNYLYLGFGCNLIGFFNKKQADILGLGFAHAHFTNEESKHETTIELTYRYPFSEHLYIQPDLQYIVQPAGTGETLNNAFVGILRFGLEF